MTIVPSISALWEYVFLEIIKIRHMETKEWPIQGGRKGREEGGGRRREEGGGRREEQKR
jgi:hypothetical protein